MKDWGWWLFYLAFALAIAATSQCSHARTRQHHRHYRHHRVVQHVAPAPVSHSFFASGSDILSAARSQIGNGAIYGRATLWCARFVNTILQRTGHKGTGSDAAASFAGLPRTTPHPGAIAVMNHHVGIVSGVDASGNPIIVSGNNMGRVREGAVSRGRVLRFVEAQ